MQHHAARRAALNKTAHHLAQLRLKLGRPLGLTSKQAVAHLGADMNRLACFSQPARRSSENAEPTPPRPTGRI